MTDRRVGNAFQAALLAALLVLLAIAGYWLLFTTFMIYDDEGYVLLSLRNYSLHGQLYDRVYTQYGPFPYLLYDTFHRLLGFAFNNTSGRWITLINWLGTATACAAVVYRTTRSSLWAAVTLTGTFTYLWVMINEPVHPGSLITLVVATATWLASEAWRAGQINRFAMITGLSCAALILTKINAGLFFFAATLAWLAINTRPRSTGRTLTWLVAVGSAMLPFVLMHRLIDAPWVRILALVFTAGTLTTLLAGWKYSESVAGAVHWTRLAAWIAGGLTVICALMMASGTSLGGLLHGVVLDPLKQPAVYSFPVRWRIGTGEVALASIALLAGCAKFHWWQNRRLLGLVAGIRIIAGLGTFLSLVGLVPTTLATAGLSYGIPLAWCCVIPLSKDPAATATRCWMALVLVFQSLQVYPVAGSQLNWGTFIWIPLLALGLHDTAPYLSERLHQLRLWGRYLVAGLILTVTLFMANRLTQTGWNNYRSSQPLGLAGAENLRLPNDITYALRIADKNLRRHADVLFSYPGLYSANLWTDLPTPTMANATHWFSLLSTVRQQEIVDELTRRPNAAILVQRDLLDYLARNGYHPDGLLLTWLIQNFEKSTSFGGYEIWAHRGRQLAFFSTARAGSASPSVLESLTLNVNSLNAPVARIDLCNVDQPRTPLVSFDGSNSSLSLAACGEDGQANETLQKARFPLAVNGPALVSLYFAPIKVHGSFSRLLLVLRDGDGGILDELLIAD